MVTIPFKLDKDGSPEIPVKITSPKTNKSITVMLLPDTGYTTTTLDAKSARPLGLDTKDIVLKRDVGNVYKLLGTVGGNITIPLYVLVMTSKGELSTNTLGMHDLHRFYKITFTRTGVIIEPKPKTTAAYTHSLPAWYKGRI